MCVQDDWLTTSFFALVGFVSFAFFVLFISYARLLLGEVKDVLGSLLKGKLGCWNLADESYGYLAEYLET